MSGHTFRPLFHFELFLLCGVKKKVLISFFFGNLYLSNFQAQFIEDTVFPHCVILPPLLQIN